MLSEVLVQPLIVVTIPDVLMAIAVFNPDIILILEVFVVLILNVPDVATACYITR